MATLASLLRVIGAAPAAFAVMAGAWAMEATAFSGEADAPRTQAGGSLLEDAAEGLEQIRNLKARFRQVTPSGTMSSGTLFIARPGRLRFEFDDPNPMLIVATGGMVYLHDADLQTTDSYPVGTTPLRFLLRKELDLDAAQVVSVHESGHGLKITLAAKDADLQGHLTLVFEPGSLDLGGWSFIDPNGEVTLVDLDEVEEVKRLPGRLFRIPSSEGAFLRDR